MFKNVRVQLAALAAGLTSVAAMAAADPDLSAALVAQSAYFTDNKTVLITAVTVITGGFVIVGLIKRMIRKAA